MNTSNPNTGARLWNLLLPAVTVLFLIVVQANHFHDRPYRQDEAWVVHYALRGIEELGIVEHILQISRQLAPENILQDFWVYLFGHVENIVRYVSTLITVITLALFYRLATDLFDRRSAFVALVVLGSYSVFVYYTHEARPYAAQAFGAVGFQWALLRYVRRPCRKYAVLSLLFGVVPFYLHPFILYVFAAQLISIICFVRWDRNLYRRVLVLYVVLALLIGLRAWANVSDRSGVIRYSIESSWPGVAELLDHYRFNPEVFGAFFLAVAAIALIGKLLRYRQKTGHPIMRLADGWREGWLFMSLIVMVGLALLVNAVVPSLTPRNLLIAAPTLALLVTIGMRQLPLQAQLLALLFFCWPFVTQFRSHNGNAGYQELAEYVEQHYDRDSDRLIIMTAQSWEWIAINYYLFERTDLGLMPDDISYVSWENNDKDEFGPLVINRDLFVTGLAKGDWRRLQPYLGMSDRLWIIVGNPYKGMQNMIDAIDTEYTLYDAVSFPGETYYRALEVMQYRRQPDVAEPLWRFGDNFSLLSWSLKGDHQVSACQTISVDTWWSVADETDSLYSSTVVIADNNGQGVANSDDVPGGIYPTSIWQAGRPYFDERGLTIPCDVAPGDYSLLLGLYPTPTGENAAVENLQARASSGEATGQGLVYLTTLMVVR